MSLLKKIGKFVGDFVKDPLAPITKPAEMLVGYSKDFKNWFDGTDAQRKANRMNLENWKLQNEYNTPEAQMARFAAAGLNPNLIYSQQNTAGSIASVQPVASGAEQVSKGLGAIMTAMSLKNMTLQNSMLSSQAAYVRQQARRMAWDNDWLEANGLSSFSPAFERNYSFGVRALDPVARGIGEFMGSLVGNLLYDGTTQYVDRRGDRPVYYYGYELRHRR